LSDEIPSSVPAAAQASAASSAGIGTEILKEVVRAQAESGAASVELARSVRQLTRWLVVLSMLFALFAGVIVYNQLRLEHFLRQTIQYYEQMLGPPEYYDGEGDTFFRDSPGDCPVNPGEERQKI